MRKGNTRMLEKVLRVRLWEYWYEEGDVIAYHKTKAQRTVKGHVKNILAGTEAKTNLWTRGRRAC